MPVPNPNHRSRAINVKGGQYVETKWRIRAFWEQALIPDSPMFGWGIEVNRRDDLAQNGHVYFIATIRDHLGRIRGMGSEEMDLGKRGMTPPVPTCETSAVGRALAMIGLSGDPEANIATAEDMARVHIDRMTENHAAALEKARDFARGQQAQIAALQASVNAANETIHQLTARIEAAEAAALPAATDAAADAMSGTPAPTLALVPARREPSDEPPTTEGHHPSFTERSRMRFMAQLKGADLAYKEVAAFTERMGWGRPSAWGEADRDGFIQNLRAKTDDLAPLWQRGEKSSP